MPRNNTALTIIVLLANAIAGYSQSAKVLYEKKIDLGLEDKILTEHNLSRDPNNASYFLLSGIFLNPENDKEYGVFSTTSSDKGKSWTKPHFFHTPEAADPWSQIDTRGNVVAAVLGMEDLFVFTSDDKGKSWKPEALNLGSSHDHPTLTHDPQLDSIYVISIQSNFIYVNAFNTNKRTFNKPSRLKFSDLSSNTMNAVFYNNTVYIPFTTFQRRGLNEDGKEKNEWLSKTLSWMVPYKNGKFGNPSLICESCEKGFPVLAVDQSKSNFNGRFYYVCSNQSPNQILFHYSNQQGTAWSAPKVLRQYNQAPHTPRNRFTGTPQVVVNNQGSVLVVWQDRMDDPTGKCQYLYGIVSTDGGLTFGKPFRISSIQSCQENEKNLWAGERWKSGGDYFGTQSMDNGNFVVTWADSRDGISQLWMSEIEVTND